MQHLPLQSTHVHGFLESCGDGCPIFGPMLLHMFAQESEFLYITNTLLHNAAQSSDMTFPTCAQVLCCLDTPNTMDGSSLSAQYSKYARCTTPDVGLSICTADSRLVYASVVDKADASFGLKRAFIIVQ